MKRFAKYFLTFSLFFVVFKAEAQVQWNKPEVVPEKLVRKNRRVLRFTGQTEPGVRIRVRQNRVKLYLDTGSTRLARIPQKNRAQFPVVADEDGFFTFDLYLPTVAVEIPLEINIKRGWQPYDLNFRVNDKKVSDFEAIKRSFMAPADDEDDEEGLDKGDNYYSSKNDEGQVLYDRDGGVRKDTNFEAWAGLGFSYFDTSVAISGQSVDLSTSGSTLVIPAFVFGLNWDYSKKLRFQGVIRSSSGSSDDIGSGLAVTGRDFNWLQGQFAAQWFSEMLNTKKPKFAFDFGLQLQQLPYFRERPGVANVTFFDNNTYNFHIGLLYRKTSKKSWGYEIYGRYLYPFSTGDTFNVESSFPLMFEFGGGLKKSIIKGLALGVFGQLNYFSTDVSYVDPIDGSRSSSLDLLLFTIDGRLIVKF